MASVHSRKNKAGEITSYQVKWRLGGGREAPVQTERFDDEPSAEVFKDAVNEHQQQWPPGWVKGKGYIDLSAAVEETSYIFRNYAREVIKNKTGVEERYRRDCYRELEMYLEPTFGNCDVRSAEHFSKRTVAAWVIKMGQTYVWRGSKRKLMSPKTLKNLHGLLSSVLRDAMEAEPPLRDRNPCKSMRLPRTDDDGAADDERSEDAEFLTPDEVAGIVSCFTRAEDRVLVRVTYGTGMRWGRSRRWRGGTLGPRSPVSTSCGWCVRGSAGRRTTSSRGRTWGRRRAWRRGGRWTSARACGRSWSTTAWRRWRRPP